MMTKVLKLALVYLALAFIAAICAVCAKAEAPAVTMVVTAVEGEETFVMDENGNIWTFYAVPEWNVNDVCYVIMDDMGTEQIYDDCIVSIEFENGIIISCVK